MSSKSGAPPPANGSTNTPIGGVWRPSHIHYLVRSPGYKELITQLYFSGDPHNEKDSFIKKSLIIDLRTEKTGEGSYSAGAFDVVLMKA